MASILVFGDSIMAGWNGKERVTETVPRQIGEILGATVTNLAVDGTRIHSGGQSLEQLVGTTDMSGYDLVMLGYGTNDWGYQDESLDDMRHGLDFFKQKLQGENPNAKVFYELPMEQFGLNSTSLDDKNNKGISQNDVINFLKQYASDNGWGYYDWRSDPLITYANRMEATGDNGWGHPTNTVMAEMAKRLAAAIKPYLSGSNDSDSIIDKMKHYKYLYFGFDPAGENANDLWRAIACLCGSNDAIHWDLIAHLPQLGNYVRDGNIAVYDDWYYLVGTTFMYRTKDFQTFEELDVSFLKRDGYKDIWAPEFFTDLNGNWHVIWCANNGSRHVYVADFDPEMGTTTNTWQQVDEDGGIDPHIWTHNGKYYLWIDGYWMYESDSYLGPFTEVKTNIQHPGIDWTNEGGKWKQTGTDWYEGEATLQVGDTLYFYMDFINGEVPGVQDSGHMVVQSCKVDNLGSWTGQQRVVSDINMRHGSFLNQVVEHNTEPVSNVDSITLQKLDDWTKINTVTRSNYTISLGGLNSIYRKLSKLMGDDTYTSLKATYKNPSAMFNRASWLYVVHVLNQIEQETNEAVSVFRTNDLVNFKTGEEVEYLSLASPTRLLIDAKYQDVISRDWSAIQNKINEMLEILKIFHM
ncbi:GDSL-type esterase/lipase family protein [Limosilactobacillus sp.]|jgi:lysophospholipase L1-like esterase|uniref:GDSL-type esterase/lipase family protein n=1 Tax=Limosilactobacillus sp. TaxID=2773925 RepID=UPI0025C3C535|nr:GDSL-type esterase/lipase family protein [Limosilactobacillus sp.]MCH3922391.1 GDSL-type esterase/lipase family protein [Limosilactobacillus sp.]MCH3929163.1 GDSL-type esterase/lipase family protein [Limosilactobacillus sp.]